MTDILATILPVLLMPVLGMLCRRTRLITEDGAKTLMNIVINLFLPAVLFSAFYKSTLNFTTAVYPVLLFAAIASGIFLGKLVTKLLRIPSPFAPFLMTGVEMGMLGYALFSILFGAENLTYIALGDLGHALAVFTVYMTMVKAESGQKQTLRETVRTIVTMPLIIAMTLGVLTSITGLGTFLSASAAGQVLDGVLSFVSAPTGAVILLVIGYQMDFTKIKAGPLIKVVIGRLAVTGFLCCAVLFLLKLIFCTLPQLVVYSIIMMFLLPPPFVLPVLIDDKTEQRFIASAISVLTVVSLLLFVLLTVIVLV